MHPPDAAVGLEDPRLQDNFPHTAGVLIFGNNKVAVATPRDESRHLSRVAPIDTGVCANLLTLTIVAKEETKVVIETPAAEATITASATANNSFEAIVAKLSANKDNKTYRGLKVRNVVVNLDDEEYPRITLVLNQEVDGYVLEGDNYVLGKTKNVFTTAYNIAGILKEDEATAMLGNYVVRNPKVAENLLSGATINLVQVPVKTGEEYRNPFTTRSDADAYVSDHDWISNLVTGIKLGIIGNKVIDKLLDRIVDDMM